MKEIDAFSFILIILCAIVHSINCKQPHILLVVADDYGWNDVGYHGSEIKTPNLDKLAGAGVKLENYYVQPVCSPTRSQLLSGRYQIHTGLQHGVIRPLQPNGLPLEIPTLADKLKEQGYSTHMVGKWHIGLYKKEYTPTYRGFDSFYGYLLGAEDYFEHTRCEAYENPQTGTHADACGLDFHDNMEPVRDKNGSYSAEVFAERVTKIVDQHAATEKDKPLFVYMPFQSVHSPLEVPERYKEQYSFIKNEARRNYAGMVSALDEAVKNITDAFVRNGLWDDTVMVFSTDNGGQVHAGGNNYPLKGWKASLWEGGIRGVGFVHGDMLQKKGVSTNELMHVSDWFPTLLTLAGGNTKDLKLDGYNVWSAISNGTSSPRKELLHNIDPVRSPRGQRLYTDTFDNRMRAAIRVGDWKLLTGDPGVDEAKHVKPPTYNTDKDTLYFDSTFNTIDNPDCVQSTDDIDPLAHCKTNPEIDIELNKGNNDGWYKFDEKKKKNIWLYNIKTDPNEYNDVSDKYPTIVRQLLDRLAFYNSTAVPCRYPPFDPNGDPQKHGGVWGPWE